MNTHEPILISFHALTCATKYNNRLKDDFANSSFISSGSVEKKLIFLSQKLSYIAKDSQQGRKKLKTKVTLQDEAVSL